MADKRMFSQSVVNSDAFLDLPLTTQALYFHLGMRADDDGFINNPKMIMRLIGANPNDLDLLIAKSFLVKMDEGVVVIKHWRVNNYIQKDRYKPTEYLDLKKKLFVKPNRIYTLDETKGNPVYPTCIQNGHADKNSIDKISLDKNSIDKISLDKNSPVETDTIDDDINAMREYIIDKI